MSDAAKNVRASANGSRKFQMKVLCGDISLVHTFDEDYFKNAEPKFTDTERNNAIQNADKHTEKFISDLDGDAAEVVVKRQKIVPMLQFAVVGNVVFEFIILEPRSGSITGIAG